MTLHDAPEAEGGKGKPGELVKAEPAEPSVPLDRLADDLMARIVVAIDDWREANELKSIPRKIAFDQAASIILAYRNLLVSSPDK